MSSFKYFTLHPLIFIYNTLRSLKNIEFRAQSTCENRFWSNTLHISSNKSTSHWLYVWLCNKLYKLFCHSRSSIACTKSLINGDTFNSTAALPPPPPPPPFPCTIVSNWNVLGLRECGDVVVEFAEAHIFVSASIMFGVLCTFTICRAGCWLEAGCCASEDGLSWPSATATGLGDESGDDVSEETCGIWISCLMWMLAKGDVPGWLG